MFNGSPGAEPGRFGAPRPRSPAIGAQWLKCEPAAPGHALAASWHSHNFNACVTRACWASQIAPVIATVPVIAGEIGENNCADTYVAPLMSWHDSKATSYLAWA